MNLNNHPRFNHNLVLGLKSGLMEADREIRQLKEKLFKYLMKELDLKTQMSYLTSRFDTITRNKKSEVESLKKNLRAEEDRNLNLSFQLEQFRAFSDEKVKEIELLKSKNIKAEKESQKDEYRMKYFSLKRKLKIILRNRHDHTDSRVLQEVANVIANDEDPNRSFSRSCPISKKKSSLLNNGTRVKDAEPLVSPGLPTSSSLQSLSEKSTSLSSISDSCKKVDFESSTSDSGYTTANFDDNSVPIESNDTRKMSPIKASVTLITEPPITSIELQNRSDQSNLLATNTKSTVSPIDSVTDFLIENEKSETEPKSQSVEQSLEIPSETSEKLTTETKLSSIYERSSKDSLKHENLEPEPKSQSVKLFTHEQSLRIPSVPSEKLTTETKSCSTEQFSIDEQSSKDSPKHENLETEPKLSPIKKSSNERSLESIANEKPTIETILSPVERLFIDEQSLENAIDILLLEMAEPLKPQAEVDDLQKFYKDPVEIENEKQKFVMQKIPKLRAEIQEDISIHNSLVGHLISTETVVHDSNIDADGSKCRDMPTNIDVLSFLEEVSNKYECVLREQPIIEEFAQKLKLESSAYETVINDQIHENVKDFNVKGQLQKDVKDSMDSNVEDQLHEDVKNSNYVLVLEKTESCYSTKEQQPVICDEVLNDRMENNDVSNGSARSNLRRKSTLNNASHAQRKRNLNSAKNSPVRKSLELDEPLTVASSNNEDELIPLVLSECDDSGSGDEERIAKKPYQPKFYVENRVEVNAFIPLPAETHFEQVWSTIKDLNIDERRISESYEASLISLDDTVIRTAFEFTCEITREPVARKEKIINLNGVKRYVEEFLRQKKSLSKIAMTNLLASLRLSNQTTTCCALETVLLNSSKCLPRKHATDTENLILLCSEIDHKVFGGFVDTMKHHLKAKMFAKTFRVDKNLKGINMISSTILQSRFFTSLSKATRNVDDVMNLLHESLMSLKNRAYPIAYGILCQWPDVLNYRPHKRLLIDVILFCFVHHKMDYNSIMYKITEVQKLIGQVYGVKLGEKTAEEYAKEAMMNISDDYWVDAIVLLCKRQMFSWTYANVIMKYLIPLLCVWKTDVVKEAVLLKAAQALHQIILCCPYGKEESCAYNFDAIVQTVSDVLLNEEMNSRALKETCCLVICELSSRRFPQCVKLLSSWMPPEGKMSSYALSQLKEIMTKEVNYQNWATFIVPHSGSTKFPFKRKGNPGNSGATTKIKPKEGVISVGITRSTRSQTNAVRANEQRGIKKKKNKKKKKT